MRRALAYTVTIALLASCTSYKNSKDVVLVGGGMIVGTLIIGSSVVEKTDVTAEEAVPTMALLIVTGALISLLGLGGMVVHAAVPKDDPPQAAAPAPAMPPGETEDARRKRVAWDLFQQARIAGYAKDCPRVANLGSQVMQLDRWTYDGYFVRDPYILQCTAPPAPAPSPSP